MNPMSPPKILIKNSKEEFGVKSISVFFIFALKYFAIFIPKKASKAPTKLLTSVRLILLFTESKERVKFEVKKSNNNELYEIFLRKSLPFLCFSLGFDEFSPIFVKFPQTNSLVLCKFTFKLNKNSSKL